MQQRTQGNVTPQKMSQKKTLDCIGQVQKDVQREYER